MRLLPSTNFKFNDFRPSNSRRRNRKPALETLEGRALLSGSQTTLFHGYANQVALWHSADLSLSSATSLPKESSQNNSLAIETNGQGVQVCLRHAVAQTAVIAAPVAPS